MWTTEIVKLIIPLAADRVDVDVEAAFRLDRELSAVGLAGPSLLSSKSVPNKRNSLNVNKVELNLKPFESYHMDWLYHPHGQGYNIQNRFHLFRHEDYSDHYPQRSVKINVKL